MTKFKPGDIVALNILPNSYGVVLTTKWTFFGTKYLVQFDSDILNDPSIFLEPEWHYAAQLIKVSEQPNDYTEYKLMSILNAFKPED